MKLNVLVCECGWSVERLSWLEAQIELRAHWALVHDHNPERDARRALQFGR